MAKNGSSNNSHNKLTRLKSAMKKLPSFSKLARTTSSNTITTSSSSPSPSPAAANGGPYYEPSCDDNGLNGDKLHPVYVGKSRRRYLLGSDVVSHPLFQELMDRSGGFDQDEDELVVANCEVVLFEHLLWMLEGGGAHSSQLGSMEELAEFYYN